MICASFHFTVISLPPQGDIFDISYLPGTMYHCLTKVIFLIFHFSQDYLLFLPKGDIISPKTIYYCSPRVIFYIFHSSLGLFIIAFISPQGYLSLLPQANVFDISFLPRAIYYHFLRAICLLFHFSLGQYFNHFISAYGYLSLLSQAIFQPFHSSLGLFIINSLGRYFWYFISPQGNILTISFLPMAIYHYFPRVMFLVSHFSLGIFIITSSG